MQLLLFHNKLPIVCYSEWVYGRLLEIYSLASCLCYKPTYQSIDRLIDRSVLNTVTYRQISAWSIADISLWECKNISVVNKNFGTRTRTRTRTWVWRTSTKTMTLMKVSNDIPVCESQRTKHKISVITQNAKWYQKFRENCLMKCTVLRHWTMSYNWHTTRAVLLVLLLLSINSTVLLLSPQSLNVCSRSP